MQYQLLPTTLINLLILLVAGGLLSYGILQYRRQRHRSELLAFVCFTTSMCLWQLDSIAADVVTSTAGTVLVLNAFNAVVAPLFVYTFVWFVLAYTDTERWVNRWTVGLAVGHVLVATAGAVLDPTLFYHVDGLSTRGPVTVLTVTFGEWVVVDRTPKLAFYAYQLYAYVLVVLSGGVLARYMLRNRDDVYAGQAVALALGIIVPLGVNVLPLVGAIPPAEEITDLAIGVTGVMFAVAVFRYRLLEVAPVGRQQVVETMADPVVMVDDEGRVVDANGAARQLVDAGPGWRSVPVEEFFAPFPEQAALFSDIGAIETEVSLDSDGRTRHFDLNVAPILGTNEATAGHVAVMREVTTLKEREQELDLMRQIQSRVLRHNIRNDLQTVRLYSEHLEGATDGQSAEIAGKLVETTDGLLSVSEKTRITEQLVEGDQTPVRVDLVEILAGLVETYRASYPEVAFSLTAPDECVVETIPAMEFAFENLVENAAQHNDGATKRVDITVTERDGETTVEIRDDGPGIPQQELDVVESGEETALKHGTGVGLWAVQWVVDTAAATVEYETTTDGTVVTVRFPDPTS